MIFHGMRFLGVLMLTGVVMSNHDVWVALIAVAGSALVSVEFKTSPPVMHMGMGVGGMGQKKNSQTEKPLA
jgi:hypothetical protein